MDHYVGYTQTLHLVCNLSDERNCVVSFGERSNNTGSVSWMDQKEKEMFMFAFLLVLDRPTQSLCLISKYKIQVIFILCHSKNKSCCVRKKTGTTCTVSFLYFYIICSFIVCNFLAIFWHLVRNCYFMKLETKHVHSKNCWVVLTQLWVKYGQTQMLG